MWYTFKMFSSDRWVIVGFILALVSQIFALGQALYYVKPGSEQVFLHYNVIFGIDLVGSSWKLYMPSLIGIGLIMVNGAIALALYQNDKIVARAIAAATALLSIFLFIGLFLIVGLNS